jgi:hypothetical protein
MDLHKAQIQGFFDIPVDHSFAAPVIIDYCSRLAFPNLTIVSPDAGGAERARAYAKRLDADLAIIDKRRSDDGTAEVMNVVGDVSGQTCIIQDDIIDTAGNDREGGARAEGERRAARIGVCGSRGAVRSGDRTARGSADRSADHHQYDSADRRSGAVQQDQGAVGRAAAGTGDSEYSRGNVGFFVVCVIEASRSSFRYPELDTTDWEPVAGSWKLSYGCSLTSRET